MSKVKGPLYGSGDSLQKSLDEFTNLIRHHISDLAGRMKNVDFTEQCLRETLQNAYVELSHMPQASRSELNLPDWLCQKAEGTFTQQLLKLLAKDINRYLANDYFAYEEPIRTFLARKLGKPRDHPDVDDCLQDTFAGIVRTLKGKNPDEILAISDLKAYHYQAALHAFLKLRAHEGISSSSQQDRDEEKIKKKFLSLDQLIEEQGDMLTDPKILEDEIEKEELNEEMRSCMSTLPDLYFKPLHLFYIEEKQIPEIAQQLNSGKSAVKSQIDRAREKLWKYLEVKQALKPNSRIEEYATMLDTSREILFLHYYQSYDFIAIAAKCQWDIGTAKSAFYRGVEQLHDYLEVELALGKSSDVKAYVGTLPDNCRMAVRLHYIENHNLHMIAVQCNWTIEKAKGYLRQGVRLLHKYLKEVL